MGDARHVQLSQHIGMVAMAPDEDGKFRTVVDIGTDSKDEKQVDKELDQLEQSYHVGIRVQERKTLVTSVQITGSFGEIAHFLAKLYNVE